MKEFIKLLKANKRNVLEFLSATYPFSITELDKYTDHLDWYQVGANENILWDLEFVRKFKKNASNYNSFYSNKTVSWKLEYLLELDPCHKKNLAGTYEHNSIRIYDQCGLTKESILKHISIWYWTGLSQIKNLNWSIDLINTFIDHWDWDHLSMNNHIQWDETMILEFKDQISWGYLIQNPSITWSNSLFEKVENYIDWKLASNYLSFEWETNFLEIYKDKLLVYDISGNSNINWSLSQIEFIINLYQTSDELEQDIKVKRGLNYTEWDFWTNISRNQALPWTDEFVDKYSDKFDWGHYGLFSNKSLSWSFEFVMKFNEHFPNSLFSLGFYGSVNYTIEMIKYFENSWDWSLNGMTSNENLPWTMELLEKYADKWEWRKKFTDIGISDNNSIPWDYKTLKKYNKKIRFDKICRNVNIVWTQDILEKFKTELDWKDLQNNESFPWTIDLALEYKEYIKWNWLTPMQSHKNGFAEKLILPCIKEIGISSLMEA